MAGPLGGRRGSSGQHVRDAGKDSALELQLRPLKKKKERSVCRKQRRSPHERFDGGVQEKNAQKWTKKGNKKHRATVLLGFVEKLIEKKRSSAGDGCEPR